MFQVNNGFVSNKNRKRCGTPNYPRLFLDAFAEFENSIRKARLLHLMAVSGEISAHGFLWLDRAAYVHLIDRWTYDAESLRSVEA